jgi:hypothetical protein
LPAAAWDASRVYNQERFPSLFGHSTIQWVTNFHQTRAPNKQSTSRQGTQAFQAHAQHSILPGMVYMAATKHALESLLYFLLCII